MNDSCDKELNRILKKAIEPIGRQELQKDLWQQMLIKLPQPGISVPAFDWVLAAIVLILSFLMPEAYLNLLAHL